MPNKVLEGFRVADPTLDKRVRLLPCQKEMVLYWHNLGTSIHSLAKMFKVSRRTIQYLIYPERLERVYELRQERGGSKVYYKKEKHTAAMRKHRAHKSEILNLSK